MIAKSTVLQISIHNEKENPIFGEGATYLKIEDDGAGGFFILSQALDSGLQELRIDPEELYLLVKKGKKIMNAYEKTAA